jgi:hypothetical protein
MSGRVRDPIWRAAIYAAPLAVGAFLLIGAFEVGGYTQSLYENPDHASTPVIAQLFDDRDGGEVILGNYPWLESLFIEHWTRGLPDHRTIWEIGPFLLYGLTVVLVGWTVARAVSRVAGVLVGLALLVPAEPVLWAVAAPALRGTTLAHAVLLSALLITVPRLASWRRAWQGVWALGLALTLAPGVASDPILMLVWGVAPFLVAVAVAWRVRLIETGSAALAAISCAAGTALGYLVERLAEHERIVYFHIDLQIDLSKLGTNARLLLEDVALFAHGEFETPFLSTHGIGWIVAAVAVVAIPVLCLIIGRRLPRLIANPSGSREAQLLGLFWATAVVGMAVVFLVPVEGVVVDTGSVRYVTILWPALLALVAITWGARAVPWLAILVVGTAALGCLELLRGDYGGEDFLTERDVAGVTRFVEANDLDHGYAGYADAAPLTYASDFRVEAYPVIMCFRTPTGRCEMPLHRMDSWYRPEPGARTFYLWDDRPVTPDIEVEPPPRRWGRPFRVARFGHLRVYAYDYDLAYVLPEGTKRPLAFAR